MAAKPRFDGEWVRLGEILRVVHGKNQKAVKDESGEYPIYGSGGRMGRANSYICPANTVIIGRKGNINKPIYVSEPFWNVDTAFGLVAKPELLDSRYLFHFCKYYDFEKLNTTCTIPSLTRRNVESIRIFLPSLSVQKGLVAQFDTILEQIELGQKQLSSLDSLVKSRFVEMFGSCTRCVSLADVCCFRSGRTLPKSDEMPSGDYLYAKVGDLNLPGNEREIKSSRSYVNADVAKNLIPKGAVVFPKRGGAISTNKKRVTVRDCCLDLNLMAVIPSEQICTEYLLAWFDQMDLAEIANGSAVPQINNKDLEPLIIPLPQMETQQKFAAFAAQVDKSRFIARRAMENLMSIMKTMGMLSA